MFNLSLPFPFPDEDSIIRPDVTAGVTFDSYLFIRIRQPRSAREFTEVDLLDYGPSREGTACFNWEQFPVNPYT